jgi:peptidoglycan/LPS O-acetylase OafA/YrhL
MSESGISGRERNTLQWVQIGRGFAATMVVLTHVTVMTHRHYGAEFLGDVFRYAGIGVDFFFVLSGFIIWFVHAGDIGRPERLYDYSVKRFTRIYPMYWIVTLAVLPLLVLGWGEKSAAPQHGGAGYLIRSLLLVPQNEMPVLSVGWTLSHELFFYLIFGLLLTRWHLAARSVVIALVLVSTAKLVADLGSDWSGKYYTHQTAADDHFLSAFIFARFNLEFGLGALAACLYQRYPQPAGACSLIFAYLLFICPMIINALMPLDLMVLLRSRAETVLYYGPVSAWIIYVSACQRRIGTSGAVTYLTRWGARIGDASYSLYLLHYPVLLAIYMCLAKVGLLQRCNPTLMGIGAAVGAIVAALAAYELIERRVNVRARRCLSLSQSSSGVSARHSQESAA